MNNVITYLVWEHKCHYGQIFLWPHQCRCFASPPAFLREMKSYHVYSSWMFISHLKIQLDVFLHQNIKTFLIFANGPLLFIEWINHNFINIIRQFQRVINVIACTYTEARYMLQPTTHLGHKVQPMAPGPRACTARYCGKQHEIKSNTRENDATEWGGKRERYEGCQRSTEHYFTAKLFLQVERVRSKTISRSTAQ